MRWILATSLVFMVLVGPAGGIRAEEGDAADGLETRLYHSGALTTERYHRLGPVPAVVSADDVSDEECPLFGTELEEVSQAFGTVSHVIELIESLVSPDFWDESERAQMTAIGERMFLATATPAVHEAIGRFLLDAEARVLGSITVDVRVVSVSDEDAAKLASAGSRGIDPALLETLDPGRTVSVTAHAGQRVSAYDGWQHAFLQDADVEVASGASILDPVVGVANAGLSLVVTVLPSDAGSAVSLTLHAFLAEKGAMRRQKTETGFDLELPSFELTEIDSTLDVPAGRWVVTDGTSTGADGRARVFLLRATPNAVPSGRTAAPVVLQSATAPPRGKVASRFVSIARLMGIGASRRGADGTNLVPSNWTPPEPPELPEPEPPIDINGLEDLLRSTVAPASWDEGPADIHMMKGGRLLLVNRQSVLDAAEARIHELQRSLRWKIVTRAQILDVPARLADALGAPGARSGTALGSAGRDVLDAALREGRAKVIEHLQVTSLRDARNAASDGNRVSYLQDYEVELKQPASLPNPTVQSFFSGSVLDVQPSLACDQRSVSLALRFSSTKHVDPIRSLATPHGPIELPALGVWQIATSLTVPIGGTAVAGIAGSGSRRRVLLVSPQLVR